MNQLMIKDLSHTEELDDRAMVAVRGGYNWHCWKPPGLGRCHPGSVMLSDSEPKPEYMPVSETRVAQAGVGIFNVSDSSLGGASISITTNGAVTASASTSTSSLV